MRGGERQGLNSWLDHTPQLQKLGSGQIVRILSSSGCVLRPAHAQR